MKFQLDSGSVRAPCRVTVVGVGGCGNNALTRLIDAGIQGVEFIAIDTDLQALKGCKAANKVAIGKELTKNFGAGGKPEVGKKAFEESKEEIKKQLEGSDMVIITAGMGGGTGTGAAPLVAEMCKNELNALTVAAVAMPFKFEAKRRKIAEEGLNEIKEAADSYMIIDNNRLLEHRNLTFSMALLEADKALHNLIKSITEIIMTLGVINIDYSDIKSVMEEGGEAFVGLGIAKGEERAQRVLESALKAPLCGNPSIEGAKKILVNIKGGKDLKTGEVDYIMGEIYSLAGEEAFIVTGLMQDENTKDEVKLTLIATGLPERTLLEERRRELEGDIIGVRKKRLRESLERFKDEIEQEEIPSFLYSKEIES